MDLVKDLNALADGVRCELEGWLHLWLRKPNFFQLRDVTGIVDCKVQNSLINWVAELNPESRLRVCGQYNQDSNSVLIDQVSLLSSAPDFPLKDIVPAMCKDLAYRHLRIRHPRMAAIYRIKHHLIHAIHYFFDSEGFFFITPPVLGGVMTACEDISRSFHVEYSGHTIFLSQSARVYKEAMVFSLDKVYLIQPSFRKDVRSVRHLQEFLHLEVEWTRPNEDQIIELEERFIIFLRDQLLNRCEEDLVAIGQDPSVLVSLTRPFCRIEYLDAVRILGLSEGDLISPEQEIELTRVMGNVPIVLLHFPIETKGFYAKPWAGNQELTETHDILVPGIGEIMGGAARENSVDKVKNLILRPEYLKKIKEGGCSIDDHEWYLDLKRYGNIQHGGFGAGIERLLQWFAGIEDIIETVPFPRVEGHYDP